MNKKLFFSFILMVMAAFLPARAAELTAYDGENINSYVPIYGYWADSYNKCEFIMAADELNMPSGSTITGLKWYLSTIPNKAWAGNFQVFIKEVEATTLDAFTGTEGATVVWEGAIDASTGAELVIEFTTAYSYNGGNLLIGVYQNEKGAYATSAFYGVNVTGASVAGYSSSSLEAITPTQRNFVPKTTFTYTPGEGPVYYKPKNLVISEISSNGAKATWEAGSTETSWNLEYKKAADEEWTQVAVTETSYVFDALVNNTNYDVRVQSNYGDGNLSSWTTSAFKTLKCDDMGYITYDLVDSYGDGWNGASIAVVDATTNETIQTLTITSGSSATGTIGICLGDTYNFVWTAGNYPSECSFTLTDPFGEVIYEGRPTAAGGFATYTYEIILYPTPKNLAVDNITQTTADATWTGEADAYNLRYRTKGGFEKFYEEGFENGQGGWTVVDNDGDGINWGLMKMTDYNMGGVPMTTADGGDYAMASCSVDANNSYVAGDNWLISPQLDLKGTLKFFASDLGASYLEHFSVLVSTTGTEIANFTALEENIATPGGLNNWVQYSYDLSAYEGQQGYVAIRHQSSGTGGYYLFADAFSIDGTEIPSGEWVVKENVTSPTTMDGLTPSTDYEVQVQAIYEEENSDWTELVDFTTLSMNVVPAGLEIAEVTATTATAEWEGIQEAYNLRYRKASEINQINEGFEYGLPSGQFPTEGGWTQIDADGDGNGWYIFSSTSPDNQGNPTVIDGSCITSASYTTVAVTPNNYLVSPKVNLGGTLSLMYRGQDPSYAAEHFGVYVSTAGNTDPADFVAVSDEIVAGTTYAELVVDLSAYAGQQGYFAIRHFNCSDEFRLNIDNIVYNNNNLENTEYEWTVDENVTSPYTIEGLDPETEYEAQVQGIFEGAKATTEWTESVFFTTLEAPEITGYDEFYVVGDFNSWNTEEGGGRIELVSNEEGNEYTGNVELEANSNFKIITFVDGVVKWFGGESDNGEYFLVNNDMLGITISLIDGANFRVEEGGEYNITVMSVGPKALNEPLRMIITKVSTGISTIGVDGYDNNAWYNLNGQKLNGKPTAPGIYINGNKKVVIK